MVSVTIDLTDEQARALERLAAQTGRTVPDVVAEVIAQIAESSDDELLNGMALARLAQEGGAFNWLYDEPDIYTINDGEPV